MIGNRLSSAPDDDGAARIGAAIRDRRRRLGLTLRELGVGSGLSIPFLSQVERDQASPSLVSLAAIARALGVDMSYFIGTPPVGQIVRRASAPERLEFGAGQVEYLRLSGTHPERKLEALLISVPPGLSAHPTSRDGEGFWYMLEGELEITVGGETFVLGPGDSAHFDQRHRYAMRSAGDMLVRMVWVGTPLLI